MHPYPTLIPLFFISAMNIIPSLSLRIPFPPRLLHYSDNSPGTAVARGVSIFSVVGLLVLTVGSLVRKNGDSNPLHARSNQRGKPTVE